MHCKDFIKIFLNNYDINIGNIDIIKKALSRKRAFFI
jgi:hypothetical protein